MPENHSPIVKKAILLLTNVAEEERGLSLGELVEQMKVPRSSVYRILNSLLAHRFVVKEGGSRYKLGPRVGELARRLTPTVDWTWLIRVAAPLVQQVSSQAGEACKLSVVDNDKSVTIHSVPSPAEYGLAVRIGHRAPLYAGGASKALLAFLPAKEIDRICGGPFTEFTPFTITDPETLRDVLDAIRRQGFAEDHGEMTQGVRSYAAPVFDAGGSVIAAVSVPFIGEKSPERSRAIRQLVMDAAARMSEAVSRERHAA